MWKFGFRKLVALTATACLLASLDASGATRTEYVEGEAIVTFKTGSNIAGTRDPLAARWGMLKKRYTALSAARGRDVSLVRNSSKTTADLIRELESHPEVERAEPNYLRWRSGRLPTGPNFAQLWGLRNTGQTVNGAAGTAGKDIGYEAAWNASRLLVTNPPIVAIIDGGAYVGHPDLIAALWRNPGEIPGNNLDDDGNGFVDDVYGYNFADDNADVSDLDDHGTHVAGTVGATGGNNTGMVGVSRNVRLMILRASGSDGDFATSALLDAMDYALLMKQRGANIVSVNASYGGGGSSTAEREAIDALGRAGVVFCAAAGNDANNNDTQAEYPASYALLSIIAVAATDQNDNLAGFSNYGALSVDLAAPGVNIFSTTPPSVSARLQVGSDSFSGEPLDYSGFTESVAGQMYDCGLGYPTNFPPAVRGNIALIARGTLFFTEKVRNAMNAGAIAAVIYNNVPGQFLGTLEPGSWIPAVSISAEDGAVLLARTPVAASLRSGEDTQNIYHLLDGTSMAAPHVSAAVAIAALNFPNETAAQRAARVIAAVDYVPGLVGKVKSRGRLNISKLVDSDQNSLGDWWELKHFGRLGISPAADPDADGLDNRMEYAADTNPTDPSSRVSLKLETNGRVSWSAGLESRQILQKAFVPGGPWLDVATKEPPTDPNGTFSDPETASGSGFYRLEIERP